jgi:hypothetical protein
MIPTLRRLRQEDHKFKASPGYKAKSSLKKKKKKERKKEERQRGVWRRKVGSSSDYDYQGKNLSS